MVYIHSGILCIAKKKKIEIQFAVTRMEVENIILSEIGQKVGHSKGTSKGQRKHNMRIDLNNWIRQELGWGLQERRALETLGKGGGYTDNWWGFDMKPSLKYCKNQYLNQVLKSLKISRVFWECLKEANDIVLYNF